MEADPMNLVPSVGEVNADRRDYPYSALPPKKGQYGNCNVEVDKKNKRIHIDPKIRGQIARINLYMEKTYGINLSKQNKQLYKSWDKMYPESKQEKLKKQEIEKVKRRDELKKRDREKRIKEKLRALQKKKRINTNRKNPKKQGQKYHLKTKALIQKVGKTTIIYTYLKKANVNHMGTMLMIVINGGTAFYSIIEEKKSLRQIQTSITSYVKKDASKDLAKYGTSVAFESLAITLGVTPGGAIIALVGIGGYMLADLAITEYEEMNKRNYLVFSDLLWTIPNSIRHKITIYSTSKKINIYTFKIEKSTIYNYELRKDTIYNNETNDKSIFH